MQCFIADTFTDGPDSGNPAAVCHFARWPADAAMLEIAARMRYSETAFTIPADDGFDIRWFTPTREVDMIGHATLAAGCVVLEQMYPERDAIAFRSRGQVLSVRRDGDGRYTLEMPSLPPHALPADDPDRAALAQALGAVPLDVLAAKHYLCVYESAADVLAMAPDCAALARLEKPAVIVTAPGAGADDADFVSRFFAPANGVPEDPASGVAHLCLAPYWAPRLGRRVMRGRALSARGGLIDVEYRGATVVLGGRALILAALAP
ncbi:MAG TPA: PhzF family phenazine biosynthesis protein [Bordetella sp.]|nr:PhzF family phenazine biosynthesis protein [Bordetella sp.]